VTVSAQTGYRYADDELDMLRLGARTVVRRRSSGRVFEVASAALPEGLPWVVATPRLSTAFLRFHLAGLLAGVLGSIVLATSVAATLTMSGVRARDWWMLAAYIVIQTVLHELAHLTALWANGHRADKVGVKLNFAVFPAVYVRMNAVHLLHRNDKVLVHTAGLWINGLVNLAALAVSLAGGAQSLAFAAVLYTPGLLANSLPLLRSDGHRTLLAVLGINERRRMRDNSMLVRALHAASWVFAAVTTTLTLAPLMP
jgi:putative peptide zinc metalloprotease protein